MTSAYFLIYPEHASYPFERSKRKNYDAALVKAGQLAYRWQQPYVVEVPGGRTRTITPYGEVSR